MIIKNSILARILKVDGIVLYPFIFFAHPAPGVKLINHELIHLLQIKRDGILRFYFNYLKEYLIYRKKGLNHMEAYLAISYEVEAYTHEKDLTYSGLWETKWLS